MVFAQIKTEERKEKKDERSEHTLTQDERASEYHTKRKLFKINNRIKLCGRRKAGQVMNVT